MLPTVRPPVQRRRTPLCGHAWTIGPPLCALLRRVCAPRPSEWSVDLADDVRGDMTLRGQLRVPTGATQLCLLVHGLGGSHDSYYVRQAAAGLHARGLATLAITLRGADLSGADVYHAGLTEDLAAALRSPALASFSAIHVLGFSLGGHMVLRWALQPTDPRVRSVAAVCSPLHLQTAQRGLDEPRGAFYRRYVLSGLKGMHAACIAQDRGIADDRAVRRVRHFREWDDLVVVPRFGFASVDDYYARMSVAEHLDRLRVPSLLVLANGDPMIPPAVVLPFLPRPGGQLTVRWAERGGHLGFPRDLDLGLGDERGLHAQLASFFASVS